MGNCQAVEAASLVMQHPNGKAKKIYAPILAKQIMEVNPRYHVALLLTTTLYSSPAATTGKHTYGGSGSPLRITKIKLLKPNDSLLLGHVYRLVTYQEVIRGLVAKKQAKMKQTSPDLEFIRKTETDKVDKEIETPRRSSVSSRWQPSLRSISEVGVGG